ncbi:NUDIX hydrolase [Pararobbsia silviterrae]|uniref:NUDIX domain-containing protein n=1 Tax=Pararobbsia silviterrae TaxID=1792498 RepID=A0A494XEX8_9BURK|nr:NUDIX domain-containing protein [Pararobbsia silviterrae]RKP46153.1 NUDIX domain-containing protein [Pararobbsia silviterrae]
MKDRATIVCRRAGEILLVAREERVRWALPGGTIKREETPFEAARRELREETTVVWQELVYLFAFGGRDKRHHVFYADFPHEIAPSPSNEILQCEWFEPSRVTGLETSIPTKEIINLAIRHEVWRNPRASVRAR